jgi:FkbM family methyltransferase
MGVLGRAHDAVNRALRDRGWEVTRFPPPGHPWLVRQQLLDDLDVEVVFDVGANAGQYGERLRKGGYRNRIVSFEPVGSAFGALQLLCASDPGWTSVRCAVGASEGQATINVAAASQTSSLLPLVDGLHVPGGSIVARETVRRARLDFFHAHLARDSRNYLKIDVQGSERAVLEGSEPLLERIGGIEMEMSVRPTYAGSTLWREDIDYLADHGFELVNIMPSYRDSRSGWVLQVDGMFITARADTPSP